jgi:DNA-binding NtrC family response regulator
MLERGEVTPLGARKSETYDVRFVAATHRDLWAEVGRGTFRGDLFYRLAVVEVHLPPLRQRSEDIPGLVATFLRANGAPAEGVDGPPLDRLRAYAWPGNVRELRNVVTRGVALSPPGAAFAQLPILLRPAAGAPEPQRLARADVPYHEAKDALVARFDREYLTDLLKRSGDNLAQAARIAGLERKYLYRVLERAGIQPSRSKDDDEER